MSKDLRQFIQYAKEAGQDFYIEVKKPLKPELEKDVLQVKLERQGRFPVLYCPKIEGSKLPLVSNLFGSYEMLGLALGMDPKASKADILREYRIRIDETKPVVVVPASAAPIKEVKLLGEHVDLGLLPINNHSPLNSGKYITVGNMVCKDPDTGIPNVGVYRHEVKGKDQLGAMLIPAHHAAYIARRNAELGKSMEVAIFIGHHPAVVLASLAWGSIDVNEYELMGGFLGESLELTPAETVDLLIPAHAEIVLEGTIDPQNIIADGPFSEWQGYYGGETRCYLIRVNCITMRKDAIYHDLSPSHREHFVSPMLGSATVIYDAVRRVVPTVKEVYLPASGRGLIVYISIAQRITGEANRAALAAVSSLGAATLVVVVDEDIDVYDEEEVLWAIVTRARFGLDTSILHRTIGDPITPTTYDETRLNKGLMVSKMIIDATKPVGLPFPTKVSPPADLWDSMNLSDFIK